MPYYKRFANAVHCLKGFGTMASTERSFTERYVALKRFSCCSWKPAFRRGHHTFERTHKVCKLAVMTGTRQLINYGYGCDYA